MNISIMKRSVRASLSAYGVSLAAVVVAVAMRLLLEPLLADRLPFITLYLAVGFAAWHGGMGPGLLALVVSAVAAVFFILAPRFSFDIDQSEYQVDLVLYGVVGFATVAMFESLRKAQRHAEEHRRVLEQEVIARRTTEQAFAEQAERLQTTLARIGDAVISTDLDGCVTNMNTVAESLTGWTTNETTGQLLDVVFRTLAESIPHLAWMANTDGHIFWYNRRWYEYTGTTPEQMEGWGWQSVHDSKELPKVLEQWKVSIANGTPFDMTFPLKGQDGQFRTFLTRVEPLKDDEGTVVRWFGTNTDITARTLAERAVAVREAHQRRVIDNILGFVGVLNTDGTLTEVNQTALVAGGVNRDEVIGKMFWDCAWWNYDSAIRQQLQEAFDQALTGEIVRYDVVVRMAGDSRMTIDFMLVPIRDSDGKVTHVIPSGLDITDRKRAELDLAEAQRKLVLAMQVGGIGAWALDIGTQNLRGDAILNNLFGFETNTTPPLDHYFNRIHTDDRDRVKSAIADAIENSTIYDQEYRIDLPDGSVRWARSYAQNLPSLQGFAKEFNGLTYDMTDRKLREIDIADREAHLRRVINNQLGLVGVIDRDGILLEVDERSLVISKARREQVIGKHFADAPWWNYDPEVAQQMRDAMRRALAGEVVRYDVSLFAHGDEGVMIDFMIAPVFGDDGQVEYLIPSGVDISERCAAEQKFRESEARFRVFATAMPQLVWACSSEGKCTFMGPQWEVATGQSCADALGDGWLEMIHPDDRERIGEIWQKAVAEVRTYETEYRLRTEAGTYRWFLARGEVLIDAANAAPHWIGTSTDIEDAKRTAALVRENEQRIRLATEATAVGIWEWNVFTGDMRWDAMMFQIYGIDPTPSETVQYAQWRESVLLEDLPQQETVLQDTARRGGKSRREFRIRRLSDGEIRNIQAVETIRTNDKGETEWLVGTNLDVTDRKDAENKLRQLAADLSETDHRKDEFMATLAHELRNPLAPIRNGLEVIKLAGANDSVELARSMMERQLTHMIRLVDDLLDISRVSQGKIDLRKERVEVRAIIDAAVETSRPLIEEAGHELVVALPDEPIFLDGDAIRLSQVVSNLLTNSTKYMHRGGHIRLTVCRESDGVVVSVADEGIGIPPTMLDQVFVMFTQVDRKIEKTTGGLGIGLSLVKKLVEMHGGTIEAKSEGEGMGSEFVVRLPVVIDAPKQQVMDMDESQPVRSSLRILVVDDNRDGANTLAMMLKIMGNDTRTAYDGQAGVDLAGEFRPDVILLDIGLPKLNGHEACRFIREQSWGHNVVLIAVTGWGQDEDRRRSQEAGFDHHMVKPVDPKAVMKMLAGIQVAKQC